MKLRQAAQGLGRLQVHEHLETARLLDRNVAWPAALEDLRNDGRQRTVGGQEVGAVGHQAAGLGETAERRNGRKLARRQHAGDSLGAEVDQRRAQLHDGLRSLLRLRVEHRVDLVRIAEGQDLNTDRHRLRRRLDRRQLRLAGVRIPQHVDAPQPGCDLANQLQPFGGQAGKVEKHPREVAIRPGQAGDKAARDRVGFEVQRHDGDVVGRGLRRPDRDGAHRHQDVDLEPDKLLRKTRQGLGFALRPARLDLDGFALDVGQGPQTVEQAGHDLAGARAGRFETRMQKADHGNASARLCHDHERRNAECSKNADCCAPVHRVTSWLKAAPQASTTPTIVF
jgi:hypothetical protein